MEFSYFDIAITLDSANGYSKSGALPWENTIDGIKNMLLFYETYANSVIIMGRKTWLTLSPLQKTYKARNIAVVSRELMTQYIGRKLVVDDNIKICESIEEALKHAKSRGMSAVLIGGAMLLDNAFDHPLLNSVRITRLNGDYDCDIKIALPSHLHLTSIYVIEGENYQIETYT